MAAEFVALYDDQCEVCQALGSWLRLLDRDGRTELRPLSGEDPSRLSPQMTMDACLRDLHVVHEDRVYRGWPAVALLAGAFPETKLISILGSTALGGRLGDAAYRLVADNRHALSRCRGGACRASRPEETRRRAAPGPFWTCWSLGMAARMPLVAAAAIRTFIQNAVDYLRTFRRRIVLLDGKLSLLFLGGFPCDLVPIVFGERFSAVLYKGVLIDPGSVKMRGSMERHLRDGAAGGIRAVVTTHRHEEHVGNAGWASSQTRAPLFAGKGTVAHLHKPSRLPAIRALIIGQPTALTAEALPLPEPLRLGEDVFEIFPAPGHCDDHIVIYDRSEKLLIAGDAFMGVHFSTPNADVDSAAWIETLDRLLQLDVEIMVEGHGHVRTLRPDIPEIAGVVIREDPKTELLKKREFLAWLRERIESGLKEGWSPSAVEASCFPWNRRHSWERFFNDEYTRAVSLGEFSRSELMKSFIRPPGDAAVFPTVYEARLSGRASRSKPPEPAGA